MLIAQPAVLLYCVPALVLAVVIQLFARRMPIAWFIRLPGVAVHETLHFLVGFLTLARPTRLSVIPRRIGERSWMLGGVEFQNLTWYNAAVTCLAPVLCIPLVAELASWRVEAAQPLGWMDAAYWFAIGNLLIAAWPSSRDLWLALRSWPLVGLWAAGWWYLSLPHA